MGFDEHLVASLVQSRFFLVGVPYSTVSDLVHDLVQAEEERQAHTTGIYIACARQSVGLCG